MTEGSPLVHFASDNNAAVHPEILAALGAVNAGHASAYGDDGGTARAEAQFRTLLGDQARAFFVFNGTGANFPASGVTFSLYRYGEQAT